MAVEDRLLRNAATCPARTLDRLSKRYVNGPALVMLKPLPNTVIKHIAISTLNLRFSQNDRGPAMVRMEVTVLYTDLRYPTMMRLEIYIYWTLQIPCNVYMAYWIMCINGEARRMIATRLIPISSSCSNQSAFSTCSHFVELRGGKPLWISFLIIFLV